MVLEIMLNIGNIWQNIKTIKFKMIMLPSFSTSILQDPEPAKFKASLLNDVLILVELNTKIIAV